LLFKGGRQCPSMAHGFTPPARSALPQLASHSDSMMVRLLNCPNNRPSGLWASERFAKKSLAQEKRSGGLSGICPTYRSKASAPQFLSRSAQRLDHSSGLVSSSERDAGPSFRAGQPAAAPYRPSFVSPPCSQSPTGGVPALPLQTRKLWRASTNWVRSFIQGTTRKKTSIYPLDRLKSMLRVVRIEMRPCRLEICGSHFGF
jgi:hypothetical protein